METDKIFLKMGKLVTTSKVTELISKNKEYYQWVIDSAIRYSHCDWGDILEEDKRLNDKISKKAVGMVRARYNNHSQGDIFIITDADRSKTTILLTEE